jgi:hypothetical protein
MDQAHLVIKKVRPLALPLVLIETNERKSYTADLSGFSSVTCFPTSQAEWEDVGITAEGFNLTWGSRFEVHVDQLIDAANEMNP